MNKLSILLNGLIKENPVLVLVLGMCPTLAITTQATNAIGMGIATTFVLLGVNTMIAALRKVIPDKVRIPCYIVFIAGFVVFAQMILEAYAYSIHQALGIFLPLITVNCIIFARAEMFASKNTVVDSVLDAISMGAGFTLTLLLMSSLREIVGSGTWFGFPLPVLSSFNVPLLTMAPGGFIVFAFIKAGVNKLTEGKSDKVALYGNCAHCPSAAVCGKGGAN
jgi:electron transport complex protein RnfE